MEKLKKGRRRVGGGGGERNNILFNFKNRVYIFYAHFYGFGTTGEVLAIYLKDDTDCCVTA